MKLRNASIIHGLVEQALDASDLEEVLDLVGCDFDELVAAVKELADEADENPALTERDRP